MTILKSNFHPPFFPEREQRSHHETHPITAPEICKVQLWERWPCPVGERSFLDEEAASRPCPNLRSTMPAVSLHPGDVNTIFDVVPTLVDLDFHILKSPRCRCNS